MLGASGPGRLSLDRLLGLGLPRRPARLLAIGGTLAAAAIIAVSIHI
jgi:hypothetical protein